MVQFSTYFALVLSEHFIVYSVPTDEGSDYLAERSCDEVYYLWQLAGGDLHMTLKKAGLIKGRPPITALAK